MPIPVSRRDLFLATVGSAVFADSAAAPPRNVREREFELTRIQVHSHAIQQAHQGLLVAQISDLHIGWETPDERIRAAIRAINDARPDLVVLTGDFLTWSRRPLERMPALLRGMKAPALACLGNHDHIVDAVAVRRELERLGICVLQNASTSVSLRGQPLTVVGVDDGTTAHDDVSKAFKGVCPKHSRLVLTHSPPVFNKLPAEAGLLCLAGHTHGGSVMIPAFTPSLYRMMGQPYVRGGYTGNGNELYVNRGLGFGTTPVTPRIGSEPEVSLFTLHSAAAIDEAS